MTFPDYKEHSSNKDKSSRKIDVRAAYLILIRAYLRHQKAERSQEAIR